jgi:hypothetical protein
MFLSHHLLYLIAIALLIAALVMQHEAKANSTQMPLLVGGGDADMSIGGVDAESGDNDGMGMDNEVGDDTGDDFPNKLHDHFDGFDDKVIDALQDEDVADIQTVNAVLNIGQCMRRENFIMTELIGKNM